MVRAGGGAELLAARAGQVDDRRRIGGKPGRRQRPVDDASQPDRRAGAFPRSVLAERQKLRHDGAPPGIPVGPQDGGGRLRVVGVAGGGGSSSEAARASTTVAGDAGGFIAPIRRCDTEKRDRRPSTASGAIGAPDAGASTPYLDHFEHPERPIIASVGGDDRVISQERRIKSRHARRASPPAVRHRGNSPMPPAESPEAGVVNSTRYSASGAIRRNLVSRSSIRNPLLTRRSRPPPAPGGTSPARTGCARR